MARRIGWLAVAGVLIAPLDRSVARADDPSLQDHYKKGMAAYALEEWDQAIAEFEDGFRAEPRAVFLYNIAEAYRQSNRPVAAVTFYRKYLALAGADAGDRSAVEGLVAELERSVESERRARGNRSPPTAEGKLPGDQIRPKPRSGKPEKYDATAIGLLGAGGLLAVAGIVLAVYGELVNATANDHSTTLDLGAREDLSRRSFGTGVAGYAAIGAGVALLLGGGIEHALRPRARRVAIGFGRTEGGLSATVGGAF